MRDPQGRKVTDLFPSIFEDDEEDEPEHILSEEDKRELQAEIDAQNERLRHHENKNST